MATNKPNVNIPLGSERHQTQKMTILAMENSSLR